MKTVVISGRSGAGKTVALRALEDLGYYCVDNLPADLLINLLNSLEGKQEKVAVNIDIRNMPDTTDALESLLIHLRQQASLDLIYLDASSSSLLQRFSETRRSHPLTRQNLSLSEAVKQEEVLLEPIRSSADLCIDTTHLSIHDLAETVRERVLGRKSGELVLIFKSFGFKYGTPKDVDYLFDVRFLPNPHWNNELRPYTGLDKPVKDFLSAQAEVRTVERQLNNLLQSWLPSLERNNRSYVTVAVGCTGGQHRSVYIVEQLAEYFSSLNKKVQVRHLQLPEHSS